METEYKILKEIIFPIPDSSLRERAILKEEGTGKVVVISVERDIHKYDGGGSKWEELQGYAIDYERLREIMAEFEDVSE